MSRTVAAAVACVVFGALIGSDGRLSTRAALLRETATLLPAGTRIVDSDYRRGCLDFLAIKSPPCLSVRFRLVGSADSRSTTLLHQADVRWRITRHKQGGSWDLRFSHGDYRARADVLGAFDRRHCRSPYLVTTSCDDYLIVEVGPPAVLPTLELSRSPGVDVGEVPGTREARLLPKRTAGG